MVGGDFSRYWILIGLLGIVVGFIKGSVRGAMTLARLDDNVVKCDSKNEDCTKA